MWSVKEVIYGCIRRLDGRVPDCKIRMHGKCFNEIQQSLIHDVGSRHNSDSNQLKLLESCCHHSLRNLCVHTDGAWWKMKKYSHQKDISNYPDGCIICLKSFSFECVSVVKMATQIMKIEGDENDKERIKCMICFLQIIFILWSSMTFQFVFICCTSHSILSGSSGHISIDPSKLSYCFWTATATCFPFVSSQQHDPLSYLQLSLLMIGI